MTKVIENKSETTSLCCSNMAASPNRVWSFDGKKTHWVAIASSADTPVLSIVSLADKVKLSITSRTGLFKDSEKLLAMIEKNMITN